MVKAEELLGGWSLVRWLVTFEDGRPDIEPLGAGAKGRIHYAPDGIMNAVIVRADRNGEPEQLANDILLGNYMHYTGEWRIDGESVVHSVDYALDPALEGLDLVRQVQIAGDDLVLTGTGTSASNGTRLHHRVEWRRLR